MESSSQISQRLFSRTTHGIKLGLERMRAAADRLGNPQREYLSFHVAGTNGKGSVCAYLESCLRGMGFPTGLFMSPHIVDFEERFIVNGRPVTSDAWVAVYRDLETTIEELGLTFFEAATLIAFELFKREKVRWAVFETGMGGRLDATNILAPGVSVITRLAMDHREFLGNDLASIAREKLGIVKRGVPLVMAEPDDPAIRELATEWCLRSGSTCEFVSPGMVQETGRAGGAPWFRYHDQRFGLPLAGGYQVQNALAAVRALAAAGFGDFALVAEGIRRTHLPGRFQVASIKGTTVIFDVGHNPDAAASFADTFAALYPGEKACIVTGIMKDKDASGVLERYCGVASRIILTRPGVERSATTADLRTKIPAGFAGRVEEIRSVAEAVEVALASCEEKVCVVGSFYTVGEGMKALGVAPYGQARSVQP
jgi:dihydrofolate synthase/folylpolyglutamate synthase